MAALVLLLLTQLVGAAPAAAHAALLETAPGADQLLDEAPREVVLTFSEPVGTVLGGSRVVDAQGGRVDDGAVSQRSDRRVVVLGLRTDLQQGTHLVQWRVVSEDGHPITGTFAFSIGVETDISGLAGPDAPAGPRLLLGASRVLGFTGLLLLVGLALFLALLHPRALHRTGVRRALWTGWTLTTVAGTAALLAQGPYASGLGLDALADGTVLREVLETDQGRALAARLALLAVAAVALLGATSWGRHATGRSPSLLLLAGLAGPLAGTFALAGHAAAGDLTDVALPVDALHLVAVCAWVGGLVALAVLLRGARRRPESVDLPGTVLTRWSRYATVAVAVMVLTGSFATWREVQTPAAVLSTDYGRLLLGKTTVVAAMLVAAWGARALVLRRFRGREPGVRDLLALRRSVVLEAGLGAAVVALTAVLVQTTPARTSYAPTYSGTSTAGALSVQVDVEPARRGVNAFHVYLQAADGRALDVPEVTGRLTREGTTVDVRLQRESLGHYENLRVVVPAAGEWRLELVVRTTEIDSATTTQTVPFR